VIGGDRTVVAAKRSKSEGFRNLLTLHKECVRVERERDGERIFVGKLPGTFPRNDMLPEYFCKPLARPIHI
jgi:hypothetical protein